MTDVSSFYRHILNPGGGLYSPQAPPNQVMVPPLPAFGNGTQLGYAPQASHRLLPNPGLPSVARDSTAVAEIERQAPTASPAMAVVRPPDQGGAEEVLRPLSSEDSNNGYWDAKNMGNGQGRSYVVRNGLVQYVSDDEMARIVASNGRRPASRAKAALPEPIPARTSLAALMNTGPSQRVDLGSILAGLVSNSGTLTPGNTGPMNSITQASPWWQQIRGERDAEHSGGFDGFGGGGSLV